MSIIVLKYQENFADNLSELAYAKIIESKTNRQFFLENDITSRKKFEYKMSNFNMDFRYISTNQVQSVTEKSYLFTRKLITTDKISKEIGKIKSPDKLVDITRFKIDDIGLITDAVKEGFRFKNTDFIVNFDILDDIKSTNSIGLYVNKNDLDDINVNYIKNAVKRLNKYLKKPILYIFSNSKDIPFADDLDINLKKLYLIDWREEFYLYTQCRNKIILSNKSSYSEGFWGTILNERGYLTAFESGLKVKNAPENWIQI